MIQPIGFIKIHRELASKPIWKNSTPEQKVIIMTLLMMADFRPNQWEWKGQKFTTEAGQFVTSLESIVQECGKGVTIRNVRTMLSKLEKCEFLTNEPTSTGRLITIANWAVYQVTDKPSTNELTKHRQTTDKRLTNDLTPKEEVRREEGEEEKNNLITFVPDFNPPGETVKNSSNFKPPSIEEVTEYCNIRSNQVDPNTFIDFYSSKGWLIGKNKMRDWKAAVRTWEKNRERTPNKSNSKFSQSLDTMNEWLIERSTK